MLPRFLSRESTLGLALAALVFWAPLPAASVTPAAELFYRLAAFGLLGLALATSTRRWSRRDLVAPGALVAVAAFGLAQSLPWPARLVGLLSPELAAHYRQARAMVETEAVTEALADGHTLIAWVPFSLDAAVTRSSAVSWFAAAALLVVALVAGRRARHRRWILWALVGAALLQVGIGLLRLDRLAPAGFDSILLHPAGRLQGTYPNPNSLSFLLELALVVVAAWCWYVLRRAVAARPGWRIALPPVALWLVLFAAIVLTGSRSGFAAALCATVVQAAVLPLMGRGRKAGLAFALLVVAVLAVLVGVTDRLEISRYETISLFEDNLRSRLLVIRHGVELWLRFPLTGTGLGTFQDGFPLVLPAEMAPTLWNRAHNDPLELLVTGGLVGIGLGALAALALLGQVWRAVRCGRHAEDRAAGLAAVGALAAAGLHELMDFGLVMPANSLVLLAIVGGAAAAGLRPAAEAPPG